MLDLVEEWMIFMKQQDLVLQLMRKFVFCTSEKEASEGANSESCAAFSGDKIKATTTHWTSSVTPPGCDWILTWVPQEVWYLWLYHGAFNLQITLGNSGKSGWKHVTGSSNMHGQVLDPVLVFCFSKFVLQSEWQQWLDFFMNSPLVLLYGDLSGGKASGKYNFKWLGPIYRQQQETGIISSPLLLPVLVCALKWAIFGAPVCRAFFQLHTK